MMQDKGNRNYGGGVEISADFEHDKYIDLLVKRLVGSSHPQKALDVGCGGG